MGGGKKKKDAAVLSGFTSFSNVSIHSWMCILLDDDEGDIDDDDDDDNHVGCTVHYEPPAPFSFKANGAYA